MAVRETDNSMLAFESEDRKLEMFPPGQEATRIIPKPIIGEIQLPIRTASRNVNAGSRTSWQVMPSRTDFGLLKTSANIRGFIPRATPNITKARTRLIVFIPPALRVTLIWSIWAAVSGLICKWLWTKISKKQDRIRIL